MVVKLIPDQIASLWDVIKYALEKAPPLMIDTKDSRWVNKILEMAMSGQVDIWVSYRKDGDSIEFLGIAITSFEVGKFIRRKSLLIYYLYAYRDTKIDDWQEAFSVVTKYAKSRQCKRIITYSDVDEIISLAKAVGGNTDIRFITFDIGGD